MKSRLLGAVCAALVCYGANAELLGRLPLTPGGINYQAYYDTITGLTWMEDASLAGTVIWSEATAAVESLNISGVTGWRLPGATSVDGISCLGSPCVDSEMGRLYNWTGITASQPGPFSNLMAPGEYWTSVPSGVGYAPPSAWTFNFGDGWQHLNDKTHLSYAWAVHDGDVVPILPALYLFASGLIGLVGMARRKAA